MVLQPRWKFGIACVRANARSSVSEVAHPFRLGHGRGQGLVLKVPPAVENPRIQLANRFKGSGEFYRTDTINATDLTGRSARVPNLGSTAVSGVGTAVDLMCRHSPR